MYGDVFYITHMPYVENFRFLHICHVEKFEITPHVEKFHISSHLSCIKTEIFPHDNFFSTNMLVALETNMRYKEETDVKIAAVEVYLSRIKEKRKMSNEGDFHRTQNKSDKEKEKRGNDGESAVSSSHSCQCWPSTTPPDSPRLQVWTNLMLGGR